METRVDLKVSEETRHELRKYKAENGETYDDAIWRLLEDTGWFEDE